MRSEESARVCKRLRIHGRVQGVGYRASFADQAEQLVLDGWVRNRLDGSVEALIAGDAQRVELMIAWAKRGPRMAQVTRVDVSEADAPLPGFHVQPTA